MRCVWLMFFCAVSWAGTPKVLMISFDGFRWDYLDHIATPNFDRLVENGLRVKAMKPAFPSLTFTNHYSLVTGHSAAKHGIVSNNFYDTQKNDSYSMYKAEDVATAFWYEEEAIWEVARNHGKVTASYFWVGSEMEGRQPDFYKPFDSKVKPETILTQVIDWLDPKVVPSPDLALAYFPFVDKAGHRYGPDSVEVIYAVQKADAIVGTLLDALDERNIEINLVIVSDHGMTRLQHEPIHVEQIISPADVEKFEHISNNYSQVDFYLKDEFVPQAAEILSRLKKVPGCTWYLRENVPFQTHALKNGHIMGLADSGYQLRYKYKSSNYQGGHGYDPNDQDMMAFCLAWGPDIIPQSSLDQVNVEDVFPLVSHLLRIPIKESEGRLDVWQKALVDRK